MERNNAAGGLPSDLVPAVREGGLVVLPTDTVYGIGADPFSEAAVSRLLGAKGRDQTMPPPILGANSRRLLELAAFSSERQRRAVRAVVDALWPGPLTVIVNTRVPVGWDTSAVGGTVALRVPDCEITRAVLELTGPLAVTSANRTGLPPARSVVEARDYFGSEVAVYVDGGPSRRPVPSTVVDFTAHEPRMVRRGDVSSEQIAELLTSI